MTCGVNRCFNFAKCGNTATYTIMDKPVCSEACYIIQILAENPNISDNDLLSHLEKFCDKILNKTEDKKGLKLSWTSCANDIEVQNFNTVVNKSESGNYKSAVTDQGFVGGIHYFEVEIPASNK